MFGLRIRPWSQESVSVNLKCTNLNVVMREEAALERAKPP
jgi:transcriptional regulator